MIGHVAFNDIGDRITWTQIEQMVNGQYGVVGYFDTNTNNFTWSDKVEIQWYQNRPPKDRIQIVPTLMTVNRALFASLSVVSIIGIIFSLALLCFNFRFRNNR